jgi:dihydrodipicolinate synthase/N-acetylneuraminate lyase
MSSHFSRREFIDGAGALAASSIFPTEVFHDVTSVNATERLKPGELRNKLRGVIAFPITPLKPDLSLDIPGLRKNLQRLLETPIAAIVAAGGTGEMYSLTPGEHLEVVRATAEEVHGRIPVIAGTEFNVPVAIELAQQSERAGADAILALPPYYPNADEEGLANYYAEIGHATPLGLLVYSRDWVNPSPAWVDNWQNVFPRWRVGKMVRVTCGDTSRLSTALAIDCIGLAERATFVCPDTTVSAFAATPRVLQRWPQSFP